MTKGLADGGTIGTAERYFNALPSNFKLTREGEIMLVRVIEREERSILRTIIASEFDVREVFEKPFPEGLHNLRLTNSTEQKYSETERFVEGIALLRSGGLTQEDRTVLFESLSRERQLIRRFGRRLRLPDKPIGSGASNPYRQVKRAVSLVESARRDLMHANMSLVARIAKKHERRGFTLLDLIQEGNMGLMRALDKFDYRMGIRFATYAAWWIRSKIRRALSEKAQLIRVPAHVDMMQRRLNAMRNRVTLVTGESPSEAELADNLQIPQSEVRRIFDVRNEQLSLDSPIRDDDDRTLADALADGDVVHPDDVIAAEQIEKNAKIVLSTLRPRERAMLMLRFGIGETRSYSLQEVGERFGISRERVRQIEVGALTKLRKMFDMRTRELLHFSDEVASL